MPALLLLFGKLFPIFSLPLEWAYTSFSDNLTGSLFQLFLALAPMMVPGRL